MEESPLLPPTGRVGKMNVLPNLDIPFSQSVCPCVCQLEKKVVYVVVVKAISKGKVYV